MTLSLILATIGVLITVKALWVLVAPASVRVLANALLRTIARSAPWVR